MENLMQLDFVLSGWITNLCHLKAIQPHCVTDQYLFHDSTFTHNTTV